MSPQRLVVGGGSDAGISAGLRARELAPATEVALLLADRYPNFSICGLPFYLSGEVSDWKDLNVYLPLGTTAHKQGRIAGENALGGRREYAGTLGTQSVKIFDLVAARTGLRDDGGTGSEESLAV